MPVVRPLERRVLLSAMVLADGTLEVTGTNGPDEITLRRGVDANRLTVQEGTTTMFVFALDRVRGVRINLGGGDDTLNVDTTPGLITGATSDLRVQVDGGAGNDALLVFGVPAGGAVEEMLAVGSDGGSGTLVSSIGAGAAQTLVFAGLESLVDTATAASLIISANDGANVLELGPGPLAGGVTPTATARFFDVTPRPAEAIVPAPAAAANMPGSAVTTSAAAPAAAAVDVRDPQARREAKRRATEGKRQAKRLAREAKRLAREQKRAAALRKRQGLADSPAPASAAVLPAAPSAVPAPESFLIDQAHLAVHFANKATLTINLMGGDDRVDVNLDGAAPAGLQTLTLEGGAGMDHIAERAVPAGVAVLRPNAEVVGPTRDFVLMTERLPPYVPRIPTDPPAPPAGASGSGPATSSRDRDDSSSRNSSSSRDRESRDRESGSSNDRDSNSSRDSNASNGIERPHTDPA